MRQMAQELADTDAIVDRFGRDRSNLIQILSRSSIAIVGFRQTISRA